MNSDSNSSLKYERSNIELRRNRVLELVSQGVPQNEIAAQLGVANSTISLDMQFLRETARDNLKRISVNTGTMTECVSTIAKLKELTLETICKLPKELTPETPPYVMVQGYHEPGDGGGGSFFWDSAFNVDLIKFPKGEDFGIVIKPDSVLFSRPGRWIRLYDGNINVKWFGAVGDGVANDSAAIVAAVTSVNAMKVACGLFLAGKGSAK